MLALTRFSRVRARKPLFYAVVSPLSEAPETPSEILRRDLRRQGFQAERIMALIIFSGTF
ncbi:MAG TPA: hypothetical protein VIL74_05915 [Pyrinomonadaceae bacterium]